MDIIITYTHTVNLVNGMKATFESVWPAHEVVGGLTFVKTENGFECHAIKNVISTSISKETSFSLY